MVKTRRGFRLVSRKIFLVYPCKGDLQRKEQIIAHFKQFEDFEFALVSLEGSDEEHNYQHFHAIIGFKKKQQFVSFQKLDILGVHGEYQGVRNLDNSVDYVTKMGDFIAEGHIDVEGILMKRSKDMVGKLLIARMVGKKTISELVDQAHQRLEDKTYTKFDKELIESLSKSKAIKNLLALESTMDEEKETTQNFYMLSEVYNQIIDWAKNHKDGSPKTSLYIKGKSGIGKTSAIEHMGYPSVLKIDHKDKAKGYLKHKHLIALFDDVSFNHLASEFKIKYVDAGRQLQMDVKGSCIFFDRKLSRIFISNSPLEKTFGLGRDLSEVSKEEAIRRRVLCIDLDQTNLQPFISLEQHEALPTELRKLYSYVNKGIVSATIREARKSHALLTKTLKSNLPTLPFSSSPFYTSPKLPKKNS